MKPVRLRLSRAKGFNLQAWSREVNGLEAVNVARPTKWGNPHRIGDCLIPDAQTAVAAFRLTLQVGDFAAPLRGKNLACWCSLPKPGKPDICHAAVLLELANQ